MVFYIMRAPFNGVLYNPRTYIVDKGFRGVLAAGSSSADRALLRERRGPGRTQPPGGDACEVREDRVAHYKKHHLMVRAL